MSSKIVDTLVDDVVWAICSRENPGKNRKAGRAALLFFQCGDIIVDIIVHFASWALFMPNSAPSVDERSKAIPATQRVEGHLRKAIATGKLLPRQRVIEEHIAQKLAVSRGPVREALLRLERDGIVVTTPRHGTFIRDAAFSEIGIVFRMRAKLEGLCARYLRENRSIVPHKFLRGPLQSLGAAAAKKNEEQFFQADMDLHRAIWHAADQPILYRTLSSLMNPYIFVIARSYSSRIPLAARFEDHQDYVRLVSEVPVLWVEREVENYFERLYHTVLEANSCFPPVDYSNLKYEELFPF